MNRDTNASTAHFGGSLESWELQSLEGVSRRRRCQAGERLNAGQQVFYVVSGKIGVFGSVGGQHCLLRTAELAGALCSGSDAGTELKALSDAEVLELDPDHLEQLAVTQQHLPSRLSSLLLAARCAEEQRRTALETDLRLMFGKFVFAVILGFCLFIFFLQFYQDLLQHTSYYYIGAAAFSLGAALCVYIIYHLKEPLAAYGLTLRHWRAALLEGLLLSALLALLVGWAWPGVNLLQALGAEPQLPLYVLVSFIQEFIFRGVTIRAFERFYGSTLYAVLMTSFLFGVLHIHSGLLLGFLSGLAGLILALVYLRHRSLVGVTILHVVMGTLATATGLMNVYPS